MSAPLAVASSTVDPGRLPRTGCPPARGEGEGVGGRSCCHVRVGRPPVGPDDTRRPPLADEERPAPSTTR